MYAFLNRNDIDNLKLAIDKMKFHDFDAARKMELLVEAYERQESGDTELGRYQGAIETLPGWDDQDHVAHVEATADLLYRALAAVQSWEEARDDEPLDDSVKRLVKAAEAEDPRVATLENALMAIASEAERGEPDALSRIRELASDVLP